MAGPFTEKGRSYGKAFPRNGRFHLSEKGFDRFELCANNWWWWWCHACLLYSSSPHVDQGELLSAADVWQDSIVTEAAPVEPTPEAQSEDAKTSPQNRPANT
eukprot:167033-Amphidinium_carterae.1